MTEKDYPFQEDALAFIKEWQDGKEQFKLQTSGSTGTPKTITVDRSQLIASATATNNHFNLTSSSFLVCPLPIQFVGGKMMLVRALLANCVLKLLAPRSNPFEHISTDHSIDLIPIVPMQFNSKSWVHHNIKHVLFGGGEIHEEIIQRLQSFSSPTKFSQSYGMTETLSHIALRDISLPPKPYKALSPNEIRTNTQSCLEIKGPVTNDQWISTNDLVTLVNKDSFHWIGRFDLVINTGGVKVHIDKIEKAISSTELSPANFQIVGLPHSKLGEEVVLVCAQVVDFDRIRTDLAALLSKFEIPRRLVYAKLHYTSSGKPDRTATRESLLTD